MTAWIGLVGLCVLVDSVSAIAGSFDPSLIRWPTLIMTLEVPGTLALSIHCALKITRRLFILMISASCVHSPPPHHSMDVFKARGVCPSLLSSPSPQEVDSGSESEREETTSSPVVPSNPDAPDSMDVADSESPKRRALLMGLRYFGTKKPGELMGTHEGVGMFEKLLRGVSCCLDPFMR